MADPNESMAAYDADRSQLYRTLLNENGSLDTTRFEQYQPLVGGWPAEATAQAGRQVHIFPTLRVCNRKFMFWRCFVAKEAFGNGEVDDQARPRNMAEGVARLAQITNIMQDTHQGADTKVPLIQAVLDAANPPDYRQVFWENFTLSGCKPPTPPDLRGLVPSTWADIPGQIAMHYNGDNVRFGIDYGQTIEVMTESKAYIQALASQPLTHPRVDYVMHAGLYWYDPLVYSLCNSHATGGSSVMSLTAPGQLHVNKEDMNKSVILPPGKTPPWGGGGDYGGDGGDPRSSTPYERAPTPVSPNNLSEIPVSTTPARVGQTPGLLNRATVVPPVTARKGVSWLEPETPAHLTPTRAHPPRESNGNNAYGDALPQPDFGPGRGGDTMGSDTPASSAAAQLNSSNPYLDADSADELVLASFVDAPPPPEMLAAMFNENPAAADGASEHLLADMFAGADEAPQ